MYICISYIISNLSLPVILNLFLQENAPSWPRKITYLTRAAATKPQRWRAHSTVLHAPANSVPGGPLHCRNRIPGSAPVEARCMRIAATSRHD